MLALLTAGLAFPSLKWVLESNLDLDHLHVLYQSLQSIRSHRCLVASLILVISLRDGR